VIYRNPEAIMAHDLFIHDPEDVAYGAAMIQGKLPCTPDNTITL